MYIEERNAELLAKRARADLVICARPHAHTSGVRQFARPHEFLSFRTRTRADVRKSCARCTPLLIDNESGAAKQGLLHPGPISPAKRESLAALI